MTRNMPMNANNNEKEQGQIECKKCSSFTNGIDDICCQWDMKPDWPLRKKKKRDL